MNKREVEDVQTRLRMAGFKLKDENCEDSCLFCNYYHLTAGDRIPVCELLGIQFGNNFEPEDCICRKFDGGIFDSLIDEVKKEAEIKQPKAKEEAKQENGKVREILNHIGLRIKKKFE